MFTTSGHKRRPFNAIVALGRPRRRLRELPLIAPGWTCGGNFPINPPPPHTVTGSVEIRVSVACRAPPWWQQLVQAWEKKSEQLEKWVWKSKVRASLGRATLSAFIWRKYFCEHLWCRLRARRSLSALSSPRRAANPMAVCARKG